MTERERITNYLDTIVKFVGLAGSASILVSIIYDWGYYHALGLSLSEVPSTLSDHARSILEWFPYISIIIFVVAVFNLILSRIEKGMSEEELIGTSRFPRFMAFVRISPYIAMIGLVILVLYNLVFLKKGTIWNSEVRLVLIIFWFIIISCIYSEKRIKDRTPKIFRMLFCWAPPALFIIASIGYSNALNSSELNNQLIWTDSKTRLEAKILRTFEKGIMIKESEKQNIVILPWDSVKKIETFVRADKKVNADENKREAAKFRASPNTIDN